MYWPSVRSNSIVKDDSSSLMAVFSPTPRARPVEVRSDWSSTVKGIEICAASLSCRSGSWGKERKGQHHREGVVRVRDIVSRVVGLLECGFLSVAATRPPITCNLEETCCSLLLLLLMAIHTYSVRRFGPGFGLTPGKYSKNQSNPQPVFELLVYETRVRESTGGCRFGERKLSHTYTA